MTCHDFTDRLPDYLDDTLDAAARAAAHRHLAGCSSCQLALRRTQALGRSLQSALERETAHLTLTPATREAILRATPASRPTLAAAPASRSAWHWLFGHPLRALTATAALAAVLLATGQLSRQRSARLAGQFHANSTWSIDVPFQSGEQVGVIHAEFSEPSLSPPLP